IGRGLDRVERHYARLLADSPTRRSAAAGHSLLALWKPDDPSCRWPGWWEDDAAVLATAAPPMGRHRVAPGPIEEAPRALARALLADPAVIAGLEAPVVAGT